MADITTKAHGRNATATMMAHQGASEFFQQPSKFKNPFASEKQRRYMWAKHPKIAKKWAHEK